MKLFTLITLAVLTVGSIEACVTYHPSTGTYTVDKNGCVNQGKKR